MNPCPPGPHGETCMSSPGHFGLHVWWAPNVPPVWWASPPVPDEATLAFRAEQALIVAEKVIGLHVTFVDLMARGGVVGAIAQSDGLFKDFWDRYALFMADPGPREGEPHRSPLWPDGEIAATLRQIERSTP